MVVRCRRYPSESHTHTVKLLKSMAAASLYDCLSATVQHPTARTEGTVTAAGTRRIVFATADVRSVDRSRQGQEANGVNRE